MDDDEERSGPDLKRGQSSVNGPLPCLDASVIYRHPVAVHDIEVQLRIRRVRWRSPEPLVRQNGQGADESLNAPATPSLTGQRLSFQNTVASVQT